MILAQMHDDRGLTVPMCDPRDSSLRANQSRRSLHRKAWKSQPRVLLYSALLVIVTYSAGTFFFRTLFKRPITTPEVAGMITGFFVAAIAIALSARRRRTSSIEAYKADCLRHSICPSCAYSLAGISAQPDDCTLCPECGAAWRLPTVIDAKAADTPEHHD